MIWRSSAPGIRENRRILPSGQSALYAPWQPPRQEDTVLTLIPYFAWSNRGKGEMRVWLAE